MEVRLASQRSTWAPGAPSSSSRRGGAAPWLPPQRRERRRAAPAAALGPEAWDALGSGLSHLLTLAYEPIVLPCSSMNCGAPGPGLWVLARRRPTLPPHAAASQARSPDPLPNRAHCPPPPWLYFTGDIVHRSTLDPVLRMEERGLNPQGLALLAAAAWYLFLTPGVLPGAIDTYVKTPLQRRAARVYGKVRRRVRGGGAGGKQGGAGSSRGALRTGRRKAGACACASN